MIFILFLSIAIIGCVLGYVLYKSCHEAASCVCWFIGIVPGVIAFIMLLVIIPTYICKSGTETKWQQRYNDLNYVIDNHIYTDIDKDELIESIISWNEDFAAQQVKQKNIWVAIFNPESLEGLDKIDLERINCERIN